MNGSIFSTRVTLLQTRKFCFDRRIWLCMYVFVFAMPLRVDVSLISVYFDRFAAVGIRYFSSPFITVIAVAHCHLGIVILRLVVFVLLLLLPSVAFLLALLVWLLTRLP